MFELQRRKQPLTGATAQKAGHFPDHISLSKNREIPIELPRHRDFSILPISKRGRRVRCAASIWTVRQRSNTWNGRSARYCRGVYASEGSCSEPYNRSSSERFVPGNSWIPCE